MYLRQFPAEFNQALSILQQIEANGYEAYFVGGSVRDFLLKRPIADVDIATSAFPAEIKQIFPRTIDTGIKHGTVTVMQDHTPYEVTTFRTESGYQDFRRPDHVTFVRSLRADLQRRDFTINALAVRADGLVIDEFSGLQDLKQHLIRAVGDPEARFHEDALRMMRAVRLSGQLAFQIDPETYQSLEEHAPLLAKIAVERIHNELIKLMLSNHWQLGWLIFVKSGLIRHTPFFDQLGSDLPLFDQMPTVPLPDEAAVWALLGLKLKLSPQTLRQLLQAWKTSNNVTHASVQTLACGQLLRSQQTLTANQLYQVDLTVIDRLQKIWLNLGWQANFAQLKRDYQALPIKNRQQLQLNGRVLMQNLDLHPSPLLGTILNEAEQAVVQGQVENSQKALLNWTKKRLQS